MKRGSFFKCATALSGITLLKPDIIFGTGTNSAKPVNSTSLGGIEIQGLHEGEEELDKSLSGRVPLGPDHLEAARRFRRIIVNLDTGWGLPGVEELDPEKFVDANLDYLTGMHGSQVDSIWWCWGEMNYAPYPSKILSVNQEYQKWLKQGKDPLPILIDRSKKKGIETFYSFRVNDSGAGDAGTVLPWVNWGLWPVIRENPHWGQPSPFWPAPFQHFNFAVGEVRDYKLSIVREVAENYDFDGIEIDWRCGYGSLPFYHKWENRDHLTAFMRSVRIMLQEVAKQRGRPFLLAVRVPECIEGCHYDGIHIERWVEDNLVDVLALGCKSFEVDLDAFRQLTKGTHVKLYPSMDDHHRASGYEHPTIELYRGAASTFLQQGADGVYAFNWYPVPQILDARARPQQEHLRRLALCEMGSLETLARKDKKYVTQRCGGGGWPETAEYFYKNTSAFAQLPKELSNLSSEETYIFLRVGDDVNAWSGDLASIELRILLSDPAAAGLPVEERMNVEPVRIASQSSRDFNEPPARTLIGQLRVRINGVILDQPTICEGWVICHLKPLQLAHGSNVVAFKLSGRNPQIKERVIVEKLEIDVRYNSPS